MTEVPFSRFEGPVKFLRHTELEPLARTTVEDVFEKFFDEEKPNVEGKHLIEDLLETYRKQGATVADAEPFRYRRFAGDGTLPRSRYFSLCRQRHNNSKTLLCELVAYADARWSDRLTIIDTGSREDIFSYLNRYGDPPEGIMRTSILCRLSRGEEPPTVVQMPYEIASMSLERVIDLRQFQTQQWLVDCLTTGIPGTRYLYSPNAYVQALTLSGDRPKDSDQFDADFHKGFFDPQDYKRFTYPPRVGWNHVAHDGPHDFRGILPFLVCAMRGGSPITDALGRWFRMLGAEALIYPSARNDVVCFYNHETLVEWSGWNLVDYRGAPEPDLGMRLIVDPDSWWLLAPRMDVRSLLDPEHRGSWLIRTQH